jgi:MFS family permease
MKAYPRSWFILKRHNPDAHINFCSYSQAFCSRFLVGFLEATFYPGAVYLISRWYFFSFMRQTGLLKGCRYKREELGYRTAFFTAGIGISNAFGSLLASGILATMEGFLGYAAWRLVKDMFNLVSVMRILIITSGGCFS